MLFNGKLIVKQREIGYNMGNSIGRRQSNEKSVTDWSGKL